MTRVINPILRTESFLTSTKERFFSVVTPIQSVNCKKYSKHSDFFSYLLNPIIDVGLSIFHLIDVAINLLNFIFTLAEAAYTWSRKQQESAKLFDDHTLGVLSEAEEHFMSAISSLIASLLNPILSFISWGTRPLASIGRGVLNIIEECSSSRSTCYS